jgi:hypothetical protein
MATTIEMLEQMEAAAAQAAAARQKSDKQHFVGNSIVVWKSGERALVRPVYNMDQAIVRPVHDKFKNGDASLSSRTYQGATIAAPISAMCATHIGKPCLFCAQPKEAKLEARPECFVPVYLYGIKDSQDNSVMFTDPDGNQKVVKGFRMLRLKSTSVIFKQLMSVWRNPLYDKNITCCDFVIERAGSTKDDTVYTCTPNPPQPMHPNLKAAIKPREEFENILLEIYEPRILERPEITLTPIQQAPTMTRADVQATISKAPEEEFVF